MVYLLLFPVGIGIARNSVQVELDADQWLRKLERVAVSAKGLETA